MPKVGRRGDSTYLESPRRQQNVLLSDAPFGTTYTPQIRVRIVGGEHQLVDDEPFTTPDPLESPRLKYLEKDLTQRLERLEKSVYNGAANQNHPASPRGQQTRSRPYQEPETLNPHSVLPPIQHQRHNGPVDRDSNEGGSIPDAGDIKLYERLPRDRVLTDRPIALDDRQTTRLYKILTEHCSVQDTPKLKEIYLSLVSHDLRMTGYVPFETFRMVFHKHQVYLPLNLFRLLGSMCVSNSGMDMVQYEKILIFIGAALKNAKNHQREGHMMPAYTYSEQPNALRDMGPIVYERPAYYQYQADNAADHVTSPRAGQASRNAANRTDIDLHRKLEDQIVLSPRFDVEKLRQGFMLADRTHRGTLSPQQIKMIVRGYGGLNLGDALMDDVIRRCDDHQGQIKWDQFLQHIERVQPLRTGLHIPDSRRPLEHARPLPTPRDSWPQQGGEVLNGAASPLSSPRGQNQSSELSPRMEQLNEMSRRLAGRNQADSLELKLRDMEGNYQKYKQTLLQQQRYGPNEVERSMSPVHDGWFNRFMKLADALYTNDVDHNGSLRPEEVRWLMGEYNDIYDLRIPLSVQESSLQSAKRSNGLVDIDTLINAVARTKTKK